MDIELEHAFGHLCVSDETQIGDRSQEVRKKHMVIEINRLTGTYYNYDMFKMLLPHGLVENLELSHSINASLTVTIDHNNLVGPATMEGIWLSTNCNLSSSSSLPNTLTTSSNRLDRSFNKFRINANFDNGKLNGNYSVHLYHEHKLYELVQIYFHDDKPIVSISLSWKYAIMMYGPYLTQQFSSNCNSNVSKLVWNYNSDDDDEYLDIEYLLDLIPELDVSSDWDIKISKAKEIFTTINIV